MVEMLRACSSGTSALVSETCIVFSADSAPPRRTFYGKMRQQLEINDSTEREPIRVKEEPFFSLLVEIGRAHV